MTTARTRAEQETILRWDAEDRRVHLYTASPVVARKWARLGHILTPHGPADAPTGWSGLASAGTVTVRRANRPPRKAIYVGGFAARGPHTIRPDDCAALLAKTP